MSTHTVVGLRPALPWPLAESSWWTVPVRAERLAALRIGVGLALLFDVLVFYLPFAEVFYDHAALGGTHGFPEPPNLPLWPWSPLGGVSSPSAWYAILGVWALLAAAIAVGFWPRPCAALALALAGAIYNANPLVFNGGDSVRHILLFYLVITPCGAVWSVHGRAAPGPIYIWPWALRLLFVQLTVIYFVTGLAKLKPGWLAGQSIYYVMASIDWTRWAYAQAPVPFWLTVAINWATVCWEIGFPVLVTWPVTRRGTLWLGVLFHVGTGVALKLAAFPLYMLCFYLPLLPWERWGPAEEPTAADAPPHVG